MRDAGPPAVMDGAKPTQTWLAESARVTAFSVQGTSLTYKPWKTIFGAEPDQIVRQPGMPTLEGGQKDGRRWVISHQPDRLDIHITPEIPTAPPQYIQNIGQFDTALATLLPIAEKALSGTDAVSRLAIGALLFESVAQIQDGNNLVAHFTPQITHIPNGATDFIFQINLPLKREKPIRGLTINRIIKWQVATVQIINVISGIGTPKISPSTSQPTVRLELDVSTSADVNSHIPSNRVSEVVRVLGGVMAELAKAGGFPS